MICFYTEGIDFNLSSKRKIKSWLKTVAGAEGKQTGAIAVIFCSGNYLLQLNRRFLQHDYHTDIITFDYTEGLVLGGDLFISTDTVCANAERYGQSFDDELHRVILHGILHLCGYEDATPAQQEIMRGLEDKYLAMRF
ncbi:MAG: rRNA maturation RNase YbeY [Prevotellaceae bacterium]|jgi:rRNA maturation RNase YbeY|nr:rRNA maturation RNase YbeY [Prevotellaceae bacterium]